MLFRSTLVPNAIIQADRDGLQELKVQIENNKTGDTLSATVGATGITASYNSTTGTLTLSKAGGGSASAFQQVLRTVTFNNASDAPDPEARRLVVSTGAVVPYFSHPDNYVRYYEYVSVSGGIRWYDAKKAAEQRSYQGLTGYLATITSQNENDFIQSKVGSDAWIGGTDDYLFINQAMASTIYANQSASENRWT